MKRQILLLAVGVACLTLFTSGTTGLKKAVKYRVNVHSASYLIIEGQTNVGDFDCALESKILHDTIEVVLDQDENGCLYFADLEFALPVKDFNCRNPQMNHDFRDLLNYTKHPAIQWKILCMDLSAMGQKQLANKDTLQINTLLTIAGEHHDYWIPVSYTKNGKHFAFSGNLPINIRDFQLEPPTKFFGLVQVYPSISIDFAIQVTLI